MSGEIVRFSAPLRHWQIGDMGGLGYVGIAGEPYEAIRGHELMRRLELGRRRGFGSVKVKVTLGDSHWATSVFPSKDVGWFLPIKKAIQRAEGLEEGDLLEIELELL